MYSNAGHDWQVSEHTVTAAWYGAVQLKTGLSAYLCAQHLNDEMDLIMCYFTQL